VAYAFSQFQFSASEKRPAAVGAGALAHLAKRDPPSVARPWVLFKRGCGVPRRGETNDLLNREMAAAYCGFSQGTFDAWVRTGLLPSHPLNGWTRALDEALQSLARAGLPPDARGRPATNISLPNVQRLRRRLVDDRYREHLRHRKTGQKLPGPLGSPECMAALIASERRYATQQQATKPSNEPPERSLNQSPSPAQQSQIGTFSAPESVTQKGVGSEPESHTTSVLKISRRKSQITQADIARIIRAAKQTGATQVEVRLNDSSTVVIRLQPSATPDIPLAPREEIVL
jgi:hypothetical protein